jgi:hypothetical protein
MFADGLFLLSDAVAMELEYDVEHPLEFANLDVLGRVFRALKLDDLYLLADFIGRSEKLFDLLINIFFLLFEGVQLMVEGVGDLALYWLVDCWLFFSNPLQVWWFYLLGKVDDPFLVDVGKIEEGVSVDEALVVMSIFIV